MDEKNKKGGIGQELVALLKANIRDYVLYIALVAIMAFFSWKTNGGFMQARNISNPKRPDGIWIRSHVGRMLRNPIYVKADMAVYNYFVEQKIPVQNPPEDFIGTNGCYLYTDRAASKKLLVLAPHDGIVDSQTWLACRRKGQNKPSSKPGGIKYTWLSGKIRCGKCGYAMIVRQKAEGQYLVCSMSREHREKCSSVGTLDLCEAEKAMLPQLKLQLVELMQLYSINKTIQTDTWDAYMRLDRGGSLHLGDFSVEWDSLPLQKKRKIAAAIIEKILVFEDKIETWWTF